ncbi:MAG TPA: BMC domain-containing protein [Candidatus Limnocylindrales bacterium]|nr:BMC domain-containing protein [Candidatus Limnocylindrales bacterium]
MMGTLGLLETTGLTPAMVAIDRMVKSAAVRVFQLELNDLYGVCVKIIGTTADVQTAIGVGRRVAEEMQGQPITTVLTRVSESAVPALRSPPEFSPLIQQPVVFEPHATVGLAVNADAAFASTSQESQSSEPETIVMNQETPMALGFIETQGFTAVFEAIDTACKAASVEVVGKEKLGGGYVTVVIQGQLSAVTSAIDTAKEKVNGLGKLIAAHVIARPSESVLKLLPKI